MIICFTRNKEYVGIGNPCMKISNLYMPAPVSDPLPEAGKGRDQRIIFLFLRRKLPSLTIFAYIVAQAADGLSKCHRTGHIKGTSL